MKIFSFKLNMKTFTETKAQKLASFLFLIAALQTVSFMHSGASLPQFLIPVSSVIVGLVNLKVARFQKESQQETELVNLMKKLRRTKASEESLLKIQHAYETYSTRVADNAITTFFDSLELKRATELYSKNLSYDGKVLLQRSILVCLISESFSRELKNSGILSSHRFDEMYRECLRIAVESLSEAQFEDDEKLRILQQAFRAEVFTKRLKQALERGSSSLKTEIFSVPSILFEILKKNSASPKNLLDSFDAALLQHKDLGISIKKSVSNLGEVSEKKKVSRRL